MTDKPIIFSAPMVRALLDGRKTQTRRVLKPQPSAEHYLSSSMVEGISAIFRNTHTGYRQDVPLPYAPGDRLWVRETWQRAWEADEDGNPATPEQTYYRADGEPFGAWEGADGEVHDAMPWRPSIHMPRWASRITLLVTDVRVQRVQDISEEDTLAEGLLPFDNGWAADSEGRCWHPTARGSFSHLWDMVYGVDAWDRNDWVAAYTFERLPA
jgi:hypothetical protein